jgi:LPXTG-site transpeptidase (sortase) family protein
MPTSDTMPTLPRRRSLALAAACLLVLATVVGAWLAWPDEPPSADLVDVAPVTVASTTTRPEPTTTASAAATTTTAPVPIGAPTHLRIDTIGLDTGIVPVGLDADGAMAIPPAQLVGWYDLGPRPGEAGSAVLAGHVDLAGERGAFFELTKLPVGAEIVVDSGGTTSRWIVFAREQIPKDDVDLTRFFTRDGPDRLTLVTCGGAFDRSARHYRDNIVVTALPAP